MPDGGARQARAAARSIRIRVGKAAAPWLEFWKKVNNDWVFNLSGLLAYNLLMSLFPMLLVLLAVVGFVLGSLAPHVLLELQLRIEQLVPGGADVFAAVAKQLANSAKPLFVIGIVTAAFAGSRLFLVLENCFGIIFRVRGRDFIQQNIMAFGMLLLYLVLVPVIAITSFLPTTILSIVAPYMHEATQSTLTYVLSFLLWSAAALVLIGSIYLVVPNQHMRLGSVWPGTLLASFLLILYEALFPLYASHFLQPDNYGSVAGFAIVILVFFYYVAFIVLLGAEVNSWMVGLRPTEGDPPAIFQSLERQGAETQTRGAAPTGDQEDT
jgi:membrane protein